MYLKLREVAEVPQPGEQVALWPREVRELSYHMEDPEPARGGLKGRVHEFLKRRTSWLFAKSKALHQIAGVIGEA